MGKYKRMDQIIKLLKSYQTTGSIKGVARQYRVSKNTVRDYLRLARSHDEDLDVVLRLPHAELRSLLYPDKALSSSDRRAIFDGSESSFDVSRFGGHLERGPSRRG